MIWHFILEKLTEGQRVSLLLVLESHGSSPGRQGFKMAVAADGTLTGSIGGGIMEHKFVEMARSRMAKESSNPEIHLQVHDKSSSSRSGMICSGEQTLYIKELFETDLPEIIKIADSVANNQDQVLEVSDTGIRLLEYSASQNFLFSRCGEEAFIYREKTGKANVLHVIGGGHCALALCRLLQGMNFTINVYDTRPGLNTMDQNIFAHRKLFLNSYDDLINWIYGGQNVYVIIMTFGYRTDDQALRALLNVPLKYLGMIGSRKKIEQMFGDYLKEGIIESLLQRVHAPAGVYIKSETPEEIAVSIAAEIIRIKNTGQ